MQWGTLKSQEKADKMTEKSNVVWSFYKWI